jgi:hypothetical protein
MPASIAKVVNNPKTRGNDSPDSIGDTNTVHADLVDSAVQRKQVDQVTPE